MYDTFFFVGQPKDKEYCFWFFSVERDFYKSNLKTPIVFTHKQCFQTQQHKKILQWLFSDVLCVHSVRSQWRDADSLRSKPAHTQRCIEGRRKAPSNIQVRMLIIATALSFKRVLMLIKE